MPAIVRIRRAAREIVTRLHEPQLTRALQRAARLTPGQAPDRELLRQLQRGWGNPQWAAPLDYLAELARVAATTPGPVLECGSGLTTVLLGVLAGRRGVESWSLEHHPRWHARVSRTVAKHDLPGINLTLAPLRSFGSFDWYDAPLSDLPVAFDLVVCDGPPEGTRGGRYGLMPVLGSRICAGALILMDDVNRPGERDVIARWQQEGYASTGVTPLETGEFALLTRS